MNSATNLIIMGNQLAWLFPWQLWGHVAVQIGPDAYEKHPIQKPLSLNKQPVSKLLQWGAPNILGLQRQIDRIPLDLSPEETNRFRQQLDHIAQQPRWYEPLTNNCATTLKDALVVATAGSQHPVHNPWFGFLNDGNPFGYAPGDLRVQLERDGRVLNAVA